MTGNNNEQISAASVLIKGAKTGTTTNVNGRFSLSVKAGSTIIISAIGYDNKEVKIGSSSNVNLRLSQVEASNLSEVIVTGVAGGISITTMAVPVTELSAAQLNNVPASSLCSALTGKVAGLKATSYRGQPGESLNILLRGDNN